MHIISAEQTGDTFGEALEFVLRAGRPCVDNLENSPRGQTFMGINRLANPEWQGWYVLDRKERAGQVYAASECSADAALYGLARAFYRIRFWRAVYADTLPASLGIALFDSAVVHGRNRALRFLQEALNTLCGARRLDVDGIFRRDTRAVLDAMLQHHAWCQRVLVREMLHARQEYCDSLACGDRSSEVCCRVRVSSLEVLVDGCLMEPVRFSSGREAGRGINC
jgi:lysozyme family protein